VSDDLNVTIDVLTGEVSAEPISEQQEAERAAAAATPPPPDPQDALEALQAQVAELQAIIETLRSES
jgi:uncharacterized protein YceH (UPF0502 family)